ncbi:MAG: hypothetical protein V2A79_14670 [Planctomycetota bacterium]
MWITHTYLGIARDDKRCLFFLLYQDYIDAESQFARELDLELERFARNLGHSAALVRPFRGDIEATRSHILHKNWTPEQHKELRRTPALLMINVDFDAFDPQEHPWFLLSFGDKMTQGLVGVYEFRDALRKLAEAVSAVNVDVFEAAHVIQHEIRLSDAAKLFEAKPGILGISVDLMQAGRFLAELYRRFVRP